MSILDEFADSQTDMRTISSVLAIDEKKREYLWKIYIEYTLLINTIFQEISRNPKFQEWLHLGKLPSGVVQTICNTLKKNNFMGLPARVYTSAVLLVSHTFKGWFALQDECRRKLEGKRRWLKVMETDLELAQNTNIISATIWARARAILTEIETQQNLSDTQQESQDQGQKQTVKPFQASTSLMSLLFQRWSSTEDSLDHRAIAHLLRNNCQVDQEEEDPDRYALRLEKKRIEIQRLEERLESRLPAGRDPLNERSQQFLAEAIALADHVAYIPSSFWLKWHRSILNSHPVDSDNLDYWFLGLAYYQWNTACEFEAWEQDLPRRTANLQTSFSALPYPLLFGSCTDLHWSWESATPSAALSTALPSEATATSLPTSHKPKRRRVRKRQKRSKERIYVRFGGKGLSHLQFKLYCDRRQLPIFKQFVADCQEYKTRSKEDKFSSGLFTLRSACLIWKEDKHATSQKTKDNQELSEAPWNNHRLYLCCTIDNKSFYMEGVEAAQQKKRIEHEQKFEGLEKKRQLLDQRLVEEQLGTEEQELFRQYLTTKKALERNQADFERFKKQLPFMKEIQPRELVKKSRRLDELHNREQLLKQQIDQQGISLEQQELLRQSIENQEASKRTQSTLNRLHNTPPSRPRQPVYQGQSDIVASVCFSQLEILGVAVIDMRSQEVLEYQNLRALLTDHRSTVLQQRAEKIKGRKGKIRVKHLAEHPKARKRGKGRKKGQRSELQLSLEEYRLVNRWRNEQRKNLTQRSEEQKQGLYQQSHSESNLAKYICRLIARRLIQLCQKWQVGRIVLPDFGDLRESIECEIQARAKRKFPDDNAKLQKQYAKELRMAFHRWNHRQLARSICSCATSTGIPVVTKRQPKHGDLRQKALKMMNLI